MKTCTSCSKPIAESSRFCSSCGQPTSGAAKPTETSVEGEPTIAAAPGSRHRRSAHTSSSPSFDEARFLPGTTIADRYRIIGLLGRGGMAEVYRADDLKLGQPVALKFLPEGLERDAGRLGRFLDEVKTALRITHPNVCRVHDIGEVDGHHYISMEYIDGEDLASLLRRIGHLPGDKAIQIARQLCAGLAAAHDQGILHRDLKPANVMLDGRGQAKITDFGLAGFEAGFEGGELLAGTPAYMAPEQLEGRAVSVRSDLYALGLVLYELFTGKPAIEGGSRAEILERQKHSTPTSLSSQVDGIDPAVERVILLLLESDPAARPASALAVAAALPGGDPLAAALAAGETPSPEMVAAAGAVGTVPIAQAMRYLAAIVVGVVAWIWISEHTAPHKIAPLQNSPAVLEHRAREVLTAFGYEELPAIDRAYGFEWDNAYGDYALQSSTGERSLGSYQRYDRPSPLRFWYRQSPGPLVPVARSLLGLYRDRVTPHDPPPLEVGMASVLLSPGGRLLSFTRVPSPFESPAPDSYPDWSRAFEEAGLDAAEFTEVEPFALPPVGFDGRRAWVGVYPEAPEFELRITAASLGDRPVHFALSGPWEPENNEEVLEAAEAARRDEENQRRGPAILLTVVLVGVLILARRNLRLGRGDRQGAIRVASFLIITNLLFWLLWATHPGRIGADGFMFLSAVSWAVARAALTALQYLALEPSIRKSWPNLLVSWSRLLAGRVRDPLIGRDVLLGLGFALLIWGVLSVYLFLLFPDPAMGPGVEDTLTSPRYVAAQILGQINAAIGNSFALVFVLLLLRLLLRNVWLATAIYAVLASLFIASVTPFPFRLALPIGTVIIAGQLYLIYRASLVALLVAMYFAPLLGSAMTIDLDIWYASGPWLVLAAIAAVTAYSFWIATRGQSLFKDEAV